MKRLSLLMAVVALLAVGVVVLAQDPPAKRQPSKQMKRVRPMLRFHRQTSPVGDRENHIRGVLECDKPRLVCCDPCGICVCEDPGQIKCPGIMMMHNC